MSDIAVQIDIATEKAATNVNALIEQLKALKTAMSDVGKDPSGGASSEALKGLLAAQRSAAKEGADIIKAAAQLEKAAAKEAAAEKKRQLKEATDAAKAAAQLEKAVAKEAAAEKKRQLKEATDAAKTAAQLEKAAAKEAADQRKQQIREETEALKAAARLEREIRAERKAEVAAIDLTMTGRYSNNPARQAAVLRSAAIQGDAPAESYAALKEYNVKLQAEADRTKAILKALAAEKKAIAAQIFAVDVEMAKRTSNSFRSLANVAKVEGKVGDYSQFREYEAYQKRAQDLIREGIKLDKEAEKSAKALTASKIADAKEAEKIAKKLSYINSPQGIESAFSTRTSQLQTANRVDLLKSVGRSQGMQFTNDAEFATAIAGLSNEKMMAFTKAINENSVANGKYKSTLAETAKAVQFLDGPLGGVAYRLTLLGDLWESSGVKMVGTIAGITAAGAAFSKFISAASQMRVVSGFLKNVTDSTQEYETALRGVLDISAQQYNNVEATGKFYGRLANATKDLGVSQKDLLGVTEALTAGFRLNMTSSGEASAVMMQFTQALGSGRLMGDEFRSMSENASVTMRLLAKEILGPSGTIAGLRAMSTEGKLTTDILVPAMAAIKDEVVGLADSMPPTIGQAFERLNTAFADLAVNAPTVTKVLDLVAYSIVGIANALPEITTGLAAGTTALLVGKAAMIGYTVVTNAQKVAALTLAASYSGLTVAQIGLTTATEGATGAFAALTAVMRANPIVAIATGVGILAAVFGDAIGEMIDFNTEADLLANNKAITDRLAAMNGEMNTLNVILGNTPEVYGAVGTATENWASLSIEQIAKVASQDRVFTEQWIQNAAKRLGAEKIHANALLETTQASADNLKMQIAEAADVRRIALATGASDDMANAIYKGQTDKLVEALYEKNKVISETTGLLNSYDVALEKLNKQATGATDATEKLNKQTENTKKVTAEFIAKGKEAAKVKEEMLKWEEKNPKPKGDVGTWDLQYKAQKEAVEASVKAQAEQEKVMQGSAKAAKSLASESEKQADTQKEVASFASNQLDQMQATLDDTRLYNDILEQSGGNIQAATLQYEIQKAQHEYILDLKKKALDVESEEAKTNLEKIASKAKELELENQRKERNAELLKKAEALGDTIEKNISDGIYAGFTDGMDGFFESMENSFLRGLADSMAGTLRAGIMPTITGIFTGNSSTTQGSVLSGGGMSLSNIGSLFSTIASGSLISPSVAGSLNSLGGSIFGYFGGSSAIQNEAAKAFSAAGVNPSIGIGTDLSQMFSLGNVAGGLAGGYLGGKVFGDSQYGSIGSAVGGIAGSFIPVPILGSAIGSFLGTGLGSMFGPGKPNPASVFGYTTGDGVSYGSKHLDTQMAKGAYAAITEAFSTLGTATGRTFAPSYLTGGYDRGTGFYALGDYKSSGVPIVRFDPNDEESSNRAVAKLGAMIAAQATDISPAIRNALQIIQESSDSAVASLDAVAFALNFETMGDTKDTVTEAEQALKDLNKRFDDAVVLTRKLQLEEGKVEEMRQKALATLRSTYDAANQGELTSTLNPLFAAMEAERVRYEAQMKEATTIGGNTALVEMVHQLNNIKIQAQYYDTAALDLAKEQLDTAQDALSLWKNLPESLADSISSLKLSDLSTLSPQQKLLEAQQQFSLLRTAANDNKDPEAAAKLADAGTTLLQLSKNYYGSTTAYADTFNSVVSGLEGAKTISEMMYDQAVKDEALQKQQVELLEQLNSKGVSETYANANDTLVSLRGTLSTRQFATAEAVIAAATPGVLAGENRRSKFLAGNAQANAAAVATLRALGIPGFASGGRVTGGIAGFDSVPALLMPGERVLNTAQAKKYDQDMSNNTNEIRALRQQIAEMQSYIRSLVELTAEGNATRVRQTNKMKVAANA